MYSFEWVQQAGNPVAYAPHLRKGPLPGMLEKHVIFQFAQGDQTVPSPTTTAILRAGDLADRATYYLRGDPRHAPDAPVGRAGAAEGLRGFDHSLRMPASSFMVPTGRRCRIN